MNLRKQLLFYLELRGMTASALARKAGIPKQTISGWTAGQSPKDISQVKKVADVLGVSVDQLCFGDPDKTKEAAATSIGALLGDDWVGGVFEVKIRRIKGAGGKS